MKAFLSRLGLLLIILSYVVLLGALYDHLSLFLIILGLFCSGWRVAHFYERVPMLAGRWLSLLTITSSIITIALVYQLGVFNVMLHLIVLGFSLKFLELKSIRDVHIFVNTGFVLLALFLIFNYTIVMALLGSLIILMLLAILLSVHGGFFLGNGFSKLLVKSCLLSLPLALLLFVVIPRLPSLWKMPQQKQATTGLSDSVTPGDIAELSRSSELAFRASFANTPVAERDRYWRVMTLDHFDGRSWSQSQWHKEEQQSAKYSRGKNLTVSFFTDNYELIVEPHFNYWIPALDYSKAAVGQVNLSDYTLRSVKPIFKREAFNIVLYQQIQVPSLTAREQKQFTQLPTQGNEKTQEWVATKLKQGLAKEALMQQLLFQFRTQNYRYTLKPPPLGNDFVDDFLFSTLAGFCVHYASSYLYVARLVGIPARMVTGYLGGEWQDQDKFLTVRQYDAHAWVEIWQGGRWQRVDPTAYVAPERVESGLEQSLSNRDEFLQGEYLSLQKWRNIKLLNQLRQKIEQIDYLWATWVVNYDNKKQLALMQAWLAKFPWLNLFSAVLIAMLCAFIVTLLFIFKPWIE
ncbi:DUF3488 and transglutaminase-like domain-containing protein [Psychromonas sp. MME2]|uniref:transglutaminase family protein n=1 Tax=Psychromonas sp. MME2 TaxID=3231033 RepID=UPI00339BC9D2